MLGELSRLFEAEALRASTRHERIRLVKISGELHAKAVKQRRSEIHKLLTEPVIP